MKSKKNYITKGFTLLLSLLCMLSLWTIPIKAEEKVDFTWEPEQPVIGETITLHGPETTYYGSDFVMWHWYLYNTVGNSPDFQGKDAEITLNKEHNEITLHCYDSEGSLLSVTKEIIAKKGRAGVSLSSTNGKFKNYRNQFDTNAYLLVNFRPQGETIGNVIFKVDDIEIYKQEEAFVANLFQLRIPKDTLNALEVGKHPVSVSSTGNNKYWGFYTELTTVFVYGVTGVKIVSPPAVMIKGEQKQLQASVGVYEDEGFLVDQSVEWKVENNTSSDTTIIDGMLSIGLDETASSLKVTATSTFDTSVSDEIEIQVVDQTHDVLPGGSTVIKDGSDGYWEFDGNYSELTGVSLDGKAFQIEPIDQISANLYMNGYTGIAGTIKEGSVQVTLDQAYLKTLSDGSHTLEVQFQSGNGQAPFEVKHKVPPVIEPEEPNKPEEPDQPSIDEPSDDQHEIISGSTMIKNGKDGLWEFTGNYQELAGILLDGKAFRIEPINKTSANLYMDGYTDIAGIVEEGSVKITLYYDFLKTLSNGSHALEVKFETNGDSSYGETSFEINIKDEPIVEPEQPKDERKDEPQDKPKEEPEVEQPKQEVIKPKETTSKEEKNVEKEKPVKDTASSQTQSASLVLYSFMSIACMMYLMNKDRKKL